MLLRGKSLRQQGVKLIQLPLQFVFVREARRALHLADDRVKRTVSVLW